jgi:methylthioribose-1-phosphate isomerase
MNVDGSHYRTIWPIDGVPGATRIIDQRELPHRFRILELLGVDDYVRAISDMAVRGAGLIGATAAYGMWAAAVTAPDGAAEFRAALADAADRLVSTRPTAKNLDWAVSLQLESMQAAPDVAAAREAARLGAAEIADSDAAMCRSIGSHGLELIRKIHKEKINSGRGNEPVHVLTHCNAGWLAFVDYGSATAPLYAAYDEGIPVHVWVDETRPRGQGAALTAWELGGHGVPHDLIADNAGGHLMQHDLVDLVITGADRVTAGGDAANKIGTYLKALAARDNNVPFYIALPSSTFDWDLDDGIRGIPIEERGADEVRWVRGLSRSTGLPDEVLVCPESTQARNWGFDVTPRRLITGLITERGICAASREGISALFPEHAGSGTTVHGRIRSGNNKSKMEASS